MRLGMNIFAALTVEEYSERYLSDLRTAKHADYESK